MNERYLVAAGRIRQELADLERVVSRAERAVAAARRRPEDQDLYLDSAALNVHDFYRSFEQFDELVSGETGTFDDAQCQPAS